MKLLKIIALLSSIVLNIFIGCIFTVFAFMGGYFGLLLLPFFLPLIISIAASVFAIRLTSKGTLQIHPLRKWLFWAIITPLVGMIILFILGF